MKILGFLILTLSLLSACSDQSKEPKCPCDVKVRVLQPDGSYKREMVRVETLEDIQKVRGSKIRVTLNPRFFKDGTISESTPEAQYFINKNNEIIPKTAISEQLFTLYKIMEDLYKFDQSTGVDQILTYPRFISLVETNGENNSDSAVYTPAFDRIRISTYSGKKAPTAWNPGIVAHEHFHSIFTKIVNPMGKTVGMDFENKVFLKVDAAQGVDAASGFNFLILKALDEGIADFWGYLHTGNSDVYSGSFGHSVSNRKVLPNVFVMDSQDELQNKFNFKTYVEEDVSSNGKNRPMNGDIYENGVKYSNLLRSMSEKIFPSPLTDNEIKIAQAEWIISSLQKLSSMVSAKSQGQMLTQADILASFVPDDQSLRSGACSDLNVFLTNNSKIPSCSGY